MKNTTAYLLLVIVLSAACSSEKNTWTSKAYHNTTAHFNGYWYAKEEIQKIEETIRKAHVDDYNNILRLFPSFDSAMAKSYDKEIQEAIKMASIAIQRHQNSKWVDDSYILVGKARHYSMDWPNAIQSFKYTNKISKDKNAKHRAIIELIRTYVEHGEFQNARSAIYFLEKEKLNRENLKRFHLEQAYYYQLLKDYDLMVRNLTAAKPMLKKHDRRGRIFFIIGQVYQKLGFESEAYNYYKKCLSTNPEYEVDFYARLYMAQVTVISKSRDIQLARKSFAKLLKDSKNKEFKDKIYYEMGTFESRRNNIDEAIKYYNKSIRHGNNTRIDGEAFLRLGELYYDTLKNYELSQAYYDSAINTLPKDYEGYEQIKTRQEILNEFVKHLKTIQWQDSLLTLATMDSAAIKSAISLQVTEKKEKEKLAAKKKKKPARIAIDNNDNNALFDNNDAVASSGEDTKGWYFANPSALAVGQNDFLRKWGNITLTDNWRRSGIQARITNDQASDEQTLAQADEAPAEQSVEDLVAAEYKQLDAQIPRTEGKKNEALAKIEEAYFLLGGIYYFKLQENDNAAAAFNRLLDRFKESEYAPESLYTLYLIYKDVDADKASIYADQLKSQYPTSQFAKILINPSYLQEASQTTEKQKAIYKDAYSLFEAGDYRGADSILTLSFNLGQTSFTPNLELLRILIIGKTEDINKYQYELDEFIKRHPEADVSNYAKTLRASSQKFQQSQQQKKGIQFIRSLNEPHYFVLVFKRKDKIDEMITSALTYFNEGHFAEHKFNVSTIVFNEEFAVAFVAEIPNVSTAIEYYRTFTENIPRINEFKNHKFDNFVITKDNFDIFYRTKGLDEYLEFFEKNYPDKNQ